MVLVVAGTVAVTVAARRIPIQIPRKVMGRGRIREGQKTFIPLRLNTANVMPIIFAQSLIIVPGTIAAFSGNQTLKHLAEYFNVTSPVYLISSAVLIIFFAYFYTSIIFNPVDLAENLKKQGGFIPGVKPGAATADYIDDVLSRITFPGAIFLTVVAMLPIVVSNTFNMPFGFGGTALLIVVGGALDTVTQVQQHLLLRHYDGRHPPRRGDCRYAARSRSQEVHGRREARPRCRHSRADQGRAREARGAPGRGVRRLPPHRRPGRARGPHPGGAWPALEPRLAARRARGRAGAPHDESGSAGRPVRRHRRSHQDPASGVPARHRPADRALRATRDCAPRAGDRHRGRDRDRDQARHRAMITIKSPREIETMAAAGRIVAATLALVQRHVRAGVSTEELDRLAEDFIRSHPGARPSFKGLYDFPATLCTSINHEVVHGIPSAKRLLEEGDLLRVDVGVCLAGLHAAPAAP